MRKTCYGQSWRELGGPRVVCGESKNRCRGANKLSQRRLTHLIYGVVVTVVTVRLTQPSDDLSLLLFTAFFSFTFFHFFFCLLEVSRSHNRYETTPIHGSRAIVAGFARSTPPNVDIVRFTSEAVRHQTPQPVPLLTRTHTLLNLFTFRSIVEEAEKTIRCSNPRWRSWA